MGSGSIELRNLSENLVFAFFLCKELKLDFDRIQKLYLLNDKVFWGYMHVFLPALKLNTNRFYKLHSLAVEVVNNIGNIENLNYDNINNSDKDLISMLLNRIKDKFSSGNELFELNDFYEYLKNNQTINLLLYDGSYITGAKKSDLDYYSSGIQQITAGKRDYVRTSIYQFHLNNSILETGK